MGAAPSSGHAALYTPDNADHAEDGRLFSPVFPRNSPPLIAELARLFEGASGPVLEIGAGTGQHAGAFSLAFPALDWWPSDPDPGHRASIAAWAAFLRAPGRGPLDLDASTDWAGTPQIAALGPLTGVVSVNVIHIAPWAVAEGIVAGAARALAPGGLLAFYGPFTEQGRYDGDGNRAFDAQIRAANPAWGLREVDDLDALAAAAGLARHRLVPMPARNRLLVYRKTG